MPLLATRGVATSIGYGALLDSKPEPPTPPSIGQLYKGGYFFGVINDGGTLYELIAAPRMVGETTTQYATGGTIGAEDNTSVTDGWTNTNVNTSTARPAFRWARSLNINGYTDWYVPARDEMELMYRNLKPVVNNNSTGNRSYTTQQGDTVFTQGNNQNSVPIGEAYTTDNPPVCPDPMFQVAASGSEALVAATGNYNRLTSTRYLGVANTVLYQSMLSGLQGTTAATGITNQLRVRAIRREVRPVYP